MHSMRLALFHNLPPGGAKRCLYEQARILKARGHTLHTYTTSIGSEDFLPLAPLCETMRVYEAPERVVVPRGGEGLIGKVVRNVGAYGRAVREMDDWEALYTRMAQEIDAGGYDAVYAHNCRFLQSPYLLCALRTPIVYYCHDTLRFVHEWATDTPPDYDTRLPGAGQVKWHGHLVSREVWRVWQEQARRDAVHCRGADIHIVNSLYSREAMLREYGVNSPICYPGIDTAFWNPGNNREREHSVVAVGGIGRVKRYDFLIEAVAAISEERRPPLHIYGYDLAGKNGSGESAFLTELRAQAKALNVILDVHRDVSDQVIRDAYRAAGVVAFAPHLEPLGLVPLEAMACGAAVVGVAEGGVRETIRDGVTGLLAERDSAVFGAALDRVLNDTALARRLGEAGGAEVEDRWTWERSTDVVEAAIERAIRRAKEKR
jgi:glycosyltransferase involved in cell wall biosynthesis